MPESKVCYYCGVPEDKANEIDVGFGKGKCMEGWEHIFKTKEEFEKIHDGRKYEDCVPKERRGQSE